MGIYNMHNKTIISNNQFQYHYENLIEPKKLETRNISINKKSYKDFMIYFTDKSITVF